MLERIELIQGSGLLHDAHGGSHRLRKTTLVFADNGRGKSTLASVLRSASMGDAARMNASQTIDSSVLPKVVLQFGSGHKVRFKNGAWSEARREVVVFDSSFVEQNVYSGAQVSTTQRKNLLEFALGESAVGARASLDEATRNAATAGQLVLGYIGQLTGYHDGFRLQDFKNLEPVEDIDTQIEAHRTRLKDAQNVAQILSRPVPNEVVRPDFDTTRLFRTLGKSLSDIHENAEQTVREQVERLGNRRAGDWLHEGIDLCNGKLCPFCNQDVSASELIRAYQTHFNEAYRLLKEEVASVANVLESQTSPEVIDKLRALFDLATAQIEGWQEHVNVIPPNFSRDAAEVPLSVLREMVRGLIRDKTARPAEALGTSDEQQSCVELWRIFEACLDRANAELAAARQTIQSFKDKLSAESVDSLKARIRVLEGTKRRYEPAVVALFADLAEAERRQREANTAKQEARDAMDAHMGATLDKYQNSINTLLGKFGARFKIKDLSANHRGAAPRSEYGIELRGRSVPLEGGPPSFATALSEGDKRTLAFAFFIASIQEDAALNTKIVVIDDPMCSLDLNRKRQTVLVLRDLNKATQQLIILAHDPFFLRDVRTSVRKADDTAEVGLLRLLADAQEYTCFGALDLDKECESPYSQHHRLLNEFVQGVPSNSGEVAKAIRPMLEGYLHRRFPGLVPTHLMFGQVVDLINGSLPSSPLSHAQNITAELNEINDYAGQFHHDADLGNVSVVVTDAELRAYVDRALAVVHRGTPLY